MGNGKAETAVASDGNKTKSNGQNPKPTTALAGGGAALASTDTLEIPSKSAGKASDGASKSSEAEAKPAKSKSSGRKSAEGSAAKSAKGAAKSADPAASDTKAEAATPAADPDGKTPKLKTGVATGTGDAPEGDAAAAASDSLGLTAETPAAAIATEGSARRRPWAVFLVLMAVVVAILVVVMNPRLLEHPAVRDQVTAVRGYLGMAPLQTPVPTILGSKELSELEELLSSLGLEPGRVDGVIDGQTRSAISEFQEMGGLPVDGEPTGDLLFELREVAGALGDG